MRSVTCAALRLSKIVDIFMYLNYWYWSVQKIQNKTLW